MVHYVLGPNMPIEILLYVDDWLFTSRGLRSPVVIMVALLLLHILGFPFSAKKYRGGLQVDYIGYYMDWETFGVGVTAKRAQWVTEYARKIKQQGVVLMRDFQSFLGRLSFA